jgi:NAD-dependent DNA ligase
MSLGGVNHSSVNNSVNLLVDCREEGAQMSAKAVKAAAKGVEVWSEEQWTQLMDEEGGEGEEE